MISAGWRKALRAVVFALLVVAPGGGWAQNQGGEGGGGMDQDGVMRLEEVEIRAKLMRPSVEVTDQRMKMNREAMSQKTRFIPAIRKAVRRSPF